MIVLLFYVQMMLVDREMARKMSFVIVAMVEFCHIKGH